MNNEKICVVVGMGPGVSLAIAKRFAQDGYRIAGIARSIDKLNDLMASISKDAVAFQADSADVVSLQKAFAQIRSTLGDPEVLIYNAAAMDGRGQLLEQILPDKFAHDFQVNVGSALVCAQEVIPAMKKAKKGTILFTGGGLAFQPNNSYATLSLGKTGIRVLAQMLHQELLPHHIHAGTVTIGGFVKPDGHFSPEKIAEQYWNLHSQQSGSFEAEIIYK